MSSSATPTNSSTVFRVRTAPCSTWTATAAMECALTATPSAPRTCLCVASEMSWASLADFRTISAISLKVRPVSMVMR